VLGDARYPNSWEATVKIRRCCSDVCVKRFEADAHWIPSQKPSPAESMEEGRLMTDARRRLDRGESDRVVARELLCAGISPDAIRHLLRMSEVRDAHARQTAEAVAVLSAAQTVVTSGPFVALLNFFRGDAKRARATGEAVQARDAVIEDLAAWAQCWSQAPD
jgi:hypothetical protein